MDDCILCCEPLRHRCVMPCGHDVICAVCALRLRVKMKDRNCVVCKELAETVIMTSQPDKSWDDYEIWGDRCGGDVRLDEEAGAFVEGKELWQALQLMRQPACGVRGCRTVLPTIAALREHLSKEHDMFLCELCLENRQDFISELGRFTERQLDRHCRKGTPGTAFKGHPSCQFCKRHFFDDHALFVHLREEHELCSVCEKEGHPHQFFSDYRRLERHMRKEHYLCPVADCRCCFSSEWELTAHAAAAHADAGYSRRLPVAFSVRSSDRDGDGIRRSEEEDDDAGYIDLSAVAPPPQRPPRAEDFPSLSRLADERAGWAAAVEASRAGGEAFPALPSSSGARPVAAAAAAAAHGGSVSGAMRSYAEMGASRGGRGGGRRRRRGAGASLTASDFPGLPASAPARAAAGQASPGGRNRWAAPRGMRGAASTPPGESAASRKARTKAVIAKVKAALNDEEQFAEFRRLSSAFNGGRMGAVPYYSTVCQMADRKTFNSFFVELVHTLADRDKQRQLLELHGQAQAMYDLSAAHGGSTGGPSASRPARTAPSPTPAPAPAARPSAAAIVAAPARSARRAKASRPPPSAAAFPDLPTSSGSRGRGGRSAWATPPSLAGGKNSRAMAVLATAGKKKKKGRKKKKGKKNADLAAMAFNFS
eukprot:PLAT4417.2.p1 GENE.PLAT4417.2~~PLAT4417.2.p1  ORF type:complete len:652 (+),score=230.65 PLAT4417.2:345-2300(+)